MIRKLNVIKRHCVDSLLNRYVGLSSHNLGLFKNNNDLKNALSQSEKVSSHVGSFQNNIVNKDCLAKYVVVNESFGKLS